MEQDKINELLTLISTTLKEANLEVTNEQRALAYNNFPKTAKNVALVIEWFRTNAPDYLK